MREVSTELKALRLHGMVQAWNELAPSPARIRVWRGHAGLIEYLLQARRQQIALCARSITRCIPAKFPIHRDLAGFDFDVSPVDRNLIEQLAQLTFTERAHNHCIGWGHR